MWLPTKINDTKEGENSDPPRKLMGSILGRSIQVTPFYEYIPYIQSSSYVFIGHMQVSTWSTVQWHVFDENKSVNSVIIALSEIEEEKDYKMNKKSKY